MAKQKFEHENSLLDAKDELESMKKQIEELKAKASVIEREKAQKIEE